MTPRPLSSSTSLLCLLLLLFPPSRPYSLKTCVVEYSLNLQVISVTCADRDLSAVPDDVPKNATSLDLNSNNISTVNRTGFSRLSKLGSLQLQFNRLSHLEDRVFEDLVSLRRLDLGANSLQNLTDDVFQGLNLLEDLSVEKNRLTYISPLVFQPLPRLKTVNLCSNGLHQLSIIASILQLPLITELKAGFNRFASFQFDNPPLNASNLRTLWFNGNPLKRFGVTRDILPRLESLDVSYSTGGLEWKVRDRVFLRSLRSLYLYGTVVSFETYRVILQSAFAVRYLMLAGMTEWIYGGLLKEACRMPALENLDLTSNDIHVLNDTLLQPCSEITELTLSGNVMVDLSEDSLRPLKRLRSISLDYNFLPKVPLAVRGLSTLKVLGLSSNDIRELHCSDFQNLTALRHLYLQKNRISILRGCAFEDLKELLHLNLRSNPVYALQDTFKVSLGNLRILYMGMNSLRSVEKHSFRGLPYLFSLDLESTEICGVENETFYGLHDLKTLVLTPYTLKRDMFRGMPNLTRLTLFLPVFNSLEQQIDPDPPFSDLPFLENLKIYNSNKFTITILPNLLSGLRHLQNFAALRFFPGTPHPDTFSYTPHLTSLQITSSNVSDPKPELLQPLPNLQTLDLSQNMLRSLDFLTRAILSALRWLSLRDNQLTVINKTLLRSLPALTYLDLSGNPFTCDCLNIGFIKWVKTSNQTQVVHGHQYTCYFPLGTQGTKLLDFDVRSCKMDVDFLCFVSSSCLVVLTLLTSFIFHFLRWQILYAFYLLMAFLYDSRKRRQGAPHLAYDAFVSFNVHDEAWVYGEMLPVLEGEQGWRLCLHHRDFQPGKPIIENIMDAIYSSRKTICVISRSYLQSEWCSREFQMASFRLFDEQKDVLILLFLEEIPDQHLSPYYRMRKLVKKRTYLSWPKAGKHTGVFWQNVRRALETGDGPTEDSNLLTASVALED
ncbi:toll-like receptor 13 [Notolabrus celidotus]|uniref:toll-like receptor 13 n=1 Tax=Notolabrus celidotus TaxID=1203425 RepID=UPI0014905451|nr:toll-like receptor 13 [Notolabrus celidotus]